MFLVSHNDSLFIFQACHFLETLYDPYFRWRAYVCGKDEERSPGSGNRMPDESTPTALHPETIPFLYESFETALVDCFPALGLDMLNIYGAILSGSRRNVSLNPETLLNIILTPSSLAIMAIQIISDNLGMGWDSPKCDVKYLCFLIFDLNFFLEVKVIFERLKLRFKRHILSI